MKSLLEMLIDIEAETAKEVEERGQVSSATLEREQDLIAQYLNAQKFQEENEDLPF